MFDQETIQQLASKLADIVVARLNKEPAVEKKYLTYEDVAIMIGRDLSGVQYLVKQGKLPICDEFGRRPRIDIDDVHAYMQKIKRWHE